MSTNYYFTNNDNTTPVHIGKATNSGDVYGLSTWSGLTHRTLEDWKNFIVKNDDVVILDEYENPMDKFDFVTKFIEGFTPAVASYNIGWHRGARTEMTQGYDGTARWWIDPTGALFHEGEFF